MGKKRPKEKLQIDYNSTWSVITTQARVTKHFILQLIYLFMLYHWPFPFILSMYVQNVCELVAVCVSTAFSMWQLNYYEWNWRDKHSFFFILFIEARKRKLSSTTMMVNVCWYFCCGCLPVCKAYNIQCFFVCRFSSNTQRTFTAHSFYSVISALSLW